MKILRAMLWLVAILPALAAFLWASLASRFPESSAIRRSLGECLPQYDFQQLAVLDAEPAHLLSRLVFTSLLHIPGVTVHWTAMANALLAVLLALALTRLVRRDLTTSGLTRPLVFFVAALLACSPALGANWLHGERVGRFAVPLLFLCGLLLLAPGRRYGVRAFFAILLAAIAPLCHDRGAFVFLALLPAMLGAGRKASIIMLLVVGNIAAVGSFYTAGQFHLAESGMFGSLFSSPATTVGEVLRTTGGLWPDLMPNRAIDERFLGLLSWLSPLLLLLLFRRREADIVTVAADPEAIDADQPYDESTVDQRPHNDGTWWSLVAFGLLSVVFHHERHGMDFEAGQQLLAQTRTELLYGGFLLPVGLIGLVASRCGAVAWPFLGGALLVVAVQDFDRGMNTLLVQRVQVERTEATVLMLEAVAGPRSSRTLPTRDVGELLMLEERGWVPTSDGWIPSIQEAVTTDPDPSYGTFVGGTVAEPRGNAIPSLLGSQVGCVILGASSGKEDFRAMSYTLMRPGGRHGLLDWVVKHGAVFPEGARLRAIGIDIRDGTCHRLGPTYVVQGETLVEEGR